MNFEALLRGGSERSRVRTCSTTSSSLRSNQASLRWLLRRRASPPQSPRSPPMPAARPAAHRKRTQRTRTRQLGTGALLWTWSACWHPQTLALARLRMWKT